MKYVIILVTTILTGTYCQICFSTERVALVIGNKSYVNAPLKNPINDAISIGNKLTSIGFKVLSVLDGNYESIEKAIYRFGQLAENSRFSLVYYSGHGIQVSGRNYIIPIGVKITKKRDLRRLIELDVLIEEASQAHGIGVVILDACRDNPFNNNFSGELVKSFKSKGLARITQTPSNIIIGFATKENSVAADGSGDHSPYALALLKYLSQKDLEIRLLFGKVRDEVMASSDQQPYTYGSIGGESWVLNPSGGVGVSQGSGSFEETISGKYFVIVGSFSLKSSAETHKRMLSQKYDVSSIVTSSANYNNLVPGFHIVVVSSSNDITDLAGITSNLAKSNLYFYVKEARK
jgi:hypothetical protein